MIWLLGALLAMAAGFAVARGGICAVAAVRQIVDVGRWDLFLAFLECASWALLALIAAQAMGVMAISDWPAQRSLSAAIAGGALFGVGALVNGACSFGSAGRLAAGEMSFLALIPAFVVGVWSARALGTIPDNGATAIPGAPMLAAMTLLLILFAAWRLWTLWRHAPSPARVVGLLAAPAWPPALAMAIVAAANIGLLLIAPAWPYMSFFTDLALHRGGQILERSMLVLIFFIGAFVGAASAGRFKLRAPTLADLGGRIVGGGVMGFGAALIPGGNDSLVLVGLPLLQPSAFAAYAAMVAVIAAGFIAQRWRARPA